MDILTRLTETTTRQEVQMDLDTLEDLVHEQVARIEDGIDVTRQIQLGNIHRFQVLQMAFAAVLWSQIAEICDRRRPGRHNSSSTRRRRMPCCRRTPPRPHVRPFM